jgi:hypothetical protein
MRRREFTAGLGTMACLRRHAKALKIGRPSVYRVPNSRESGCSLGLDQHGERFDPVAPTEACLFLSLFVQPSVPAVSGPRYWRG